MQARGRFLLVEGKVETGSKACRSKAERWPWLCRASTFSRSSSHYFTASLSEQLSAVFRRWWVYQEVQTEVLMLMDRRCLELKLNTVAKSNTKRQRGRFPVSV